MELWADRAGAPRQAAVVPAVGSSGAQDVAHASIEIERAVLETPAPDTLRGRADPGSARKATLVAARPAARAAARSAHAGISRPGRRARGHTSHESRVRWGSDARARSGVPGAGREAAMRAIRSDRNRPRRARSRALRSPAATIDRADAAVHPALPSNLERRAIERCRRSRATRRFPAPPPRALRRAHRAAGERRRAPRDRARRRADTIDRGRAR